MSGYSLGSTSLWWGFAKQKIGTSVRLPAPASPLNYQLSTINNFASPAAGSLLRNKIVWSFNLFLLDVTSWNAF